MHWRLAATPTVPAHTEVITLYVEGVKSGPGFMRALEDVVARKPVVAIKAGLPLAARLPGHPRLVRWRARVERSVVIFADS